MEQCESEAGGNCARPAIWQQSVYAGDRASGRFLYHAYWCDEHAEGVVERRRQDWVAPPKMARIGCEEA